MRFEDGCGLGMEQLRTSFVPSSPRRGGRDINKLLRSLLSGADGVVIYHQNIMCWNWITTPSARLRTLRGIFYIAQPPLLGEEGKKLAFNEFPNPTPADIRV